MPLDALQQRRLMGRFATGVTVLTARRGDSVWAMTANAFMSLSLDPPRVLVSVRCDSYMHTYLVEGGCFAVNVLGWDQEAVARRFAARGPKDFEGVATTTAVTGAPLLVRALAYVDCRLVERLRGGDHDLFVGEPVAGQVRDGGPLVFFAGRYRQLAPLPPDEPAEAFSEDSYDLYGCF